MRNARTQTWRNCDSRNCAGRGRMPERSRTRWRRRLDDALPRALVAWLAEQVAVPSSSLSGYGLSDATRSSYRRLAIRHPDLRAFVPNLHMETAIGFAARGAFDADDGCRIMVRLTHDMRASRIVLPPVATLERIGIAGRAHARRIAAQAINDSLDETQRATMGNLLQADPELDQSRLEWLRRWPQAKSVTYLDGILDRLEFVRALSLPPEFGEDIHPAKLSRFAREGRVAAVDRICTPMPGVPVLAARLQPSDRAGALQFPHRPCVRHGGPLRPRPGEDGAPMRSGRRGDDDDGAGPRPVGRTVGYYAPLVRWPCLNAA